MGSFKDLPLMFTAEAALLPTASIEVVVGFFFLTYFLIV